MRVNILLLLYIAFWSCKAPKENTQQHTPKESLKLEFASGFEVDYYDGYKVVKVLRPYMNATSGFEYILTENPEELPEELSDKKVIEIPLKNIVCTSTTHIPLLDELDETEKLIGFPTTDYISSQKMRARIDEGLVTDLGVDNEMNIELLAEIDPDMVMAYTIGGDYGQFNKIQQLDIPTVINAEYLEEHPLGRAEWIKFMAAFFNKEKMADSVFNAIKDNYFKLRMKVVTLSVLPSVMSGVVYGDTWYMPGGRNYAARLINDAGAHYMWSADSTSGFLELSFEAVYEKAHKADFWIGVASFETLDQIKEADTRYADFSAFKNKNVFNNNARKGAKGGSEFLELGYLRPDLILQDLIKIIHPEMLQEHELYFHKRLEE